MDMYMRSTTFEVPFKALLNEPGVNWFCDAVPTSATAGNRTVSKTLGSDDFLTAIHRDRPKIGLVCPRPAPYAAHQSNATMPTTCSPPVQDANDGDTRLDDMYIHVITADRYRTFGVYADDKNQPCLVMAVHKSTFSTGAAAPKGAIAARSHSTLHDPEDNLIKAVAHAHTSTDWARFLLYSNDMIMADNTVEHEMGQWCLLDEGQGNFLEAALSPDLMSVQVSLTRSVHIAMDIPYSALMRRSPDEDFEETGFMWLHEYMQQEGHPKTSNEPRLLFGPARHPALAALHHDRPTVAIAWPCENSRGEVVEDDGGQQLVDVFTFPPDMYESGGVWYDEDLEACTPLRVTFHERDRVDDDGWRASSGEVDAEVAVVLLYPQHRVDVVDGIKEWGEWAFVDTGKGVALMSGPAHFPQCRAAPVLCRPLPWGMQRCWE